MLDLYWMYATTENKLSGLVPPELVKLIQIEIQDEELIALGAFVIAIRMRNFAIAVQKIPLLPRTFDWNIYLPEFLRFQRYEVVNLRISGPVEKLTSYHYIVASEVPKGHLLWEKNVGDQVGPYERVAVGKFFGTNSYGRIWEVHTPFGGVVQTIFLQKDDPLQAGDVVGTLLRTEFNE